MVIKVIHGIKLMLDYSAGGRLIANQAVLPLNIYRGSTSASYYYFSNLGSIDHDG